MTNRTIPRYKLLPDGLDYVADSDPDCLRKRNGRPNVGAIARAARLDGGAFNRVATGRRPWAGYGTVRRVAKVAATARGVSIEEAERMIFEPVEDAAIA